MIAGSAFVSEAAYVVGEVVMGEHSSVWPGAVLRGDTGYIRIGHNTHVEDNCTIHSGDVDIGDDVTIGHNAVIHCRSIGDGTLIGNSATLLDGVIIGRHCVVAAGAVVRAKTTVPDHSLAIGVPAIIRPLPENLRIFTTYYNKPYAELAARYKAEGLGSPEVEMSGTEAQPPIASPEQR